MPLILADVIAGPSAIAVSGGVDSMTLAVLRTGCWAAAASP